MTKNEVTLQLTLKAIEEKGLQFERSPSVEKELEKINAFNAKQIADFFNMISESLSEPK